MDDLSASVNGLRTVIEGTHQSIRSELDAMRGEGGQRSLRVEVDNLREQLEQGILELRADVDLVAESSLAVSDLETKVSALGVRVTRVSDQLRDARGLANWAFSKALSSDAGLGGDPSPDHRGARRFSYSAVMAPFQAPQELVKETFMTYLDRYFTGFTGTILDLGCGKGAFLEACQDRGLTAIGVDSDPVNIAICTGLGLRAELADVFTYLNQVADGSLDAVFMAHLIEHLNIEGKRELMAVLHQKIRPDGIAVVETPNTSSSRVMTTMYYLDPTHQSPLHPEAYKRVLELSGFTTMDAFLSGELEGAEMLPDSERLMNFSWVGRR